MNNANTRKGVIDPRSGSIVSNDSAQIVTPNGQILGSAFIIQSSTWIPAQVITRLRIVGTGNLTIDSRDRNGSVTSNILSTSYSNTLESIEYVYPGDTGVEIRATFPSTLTVEVI